MLNEDETRFLAHMVRWGSEGYPIRKAGNRRWLWEPFCGIQGSPLVYPTKRAAIAAIEAYLDILIDKKAGKITV